MQLAPVDDSQLMTQTETLCLQQTCGKLSRCARAFVGDTVLHALPCLRSPLLLEDQSVCASTETNVARARRLLLLERVLDPHRTMLPFRALSLQAQLKAG